MALRVLLLTPDFPPQVGGIQRLLGRLVGHAERGEVEGLTVPANGAKSWDAEQPFSILRAGGAPSRQLGIVRLNAEAVAHARRTRPDLVLAGHVVTAPAAMAIDRLLGIPYVLYLYALEVRERARLAGVAARRARAVIAISRYTADLARDVGAPEDVIRIVPPGVDVTPAPPPANGGPPRILTVSRLAERYKGHDVMVRALPLIRARIPDAEWIVVGDGPLRAEIGRLAASNGVEAAVRLCGSVTDDERDAWYERSHVFAMPSRLPPG